MRIRPDTICTVDYLQLMSSGASAALRIHPDTIEACEQRTARRHTGGVLVDDATIAEHIAAAADLAALDEWLHDLEHAWLYGYGQPAPR